MITRSRYAACVALAIVLTGSEARGVPAAQEPPTKATLTRFQREVNDYLTLRWRATRDLPPLPSNAKLPEVIVAVEQQVRAVRRARAGARMGEIFLTDVASLIRRSLLAAIDEHALDVARILKEVACDAPQFLGRPQVNDRLPWLRSATMPDLLLEALPALPFELRYRFVGRDLVLLDVDLGLAVDVLPDALPAPLGR